MKDREINYRRGPLNLSVKISEERTIVKFNDEEIDPNAFYSMKARLPRVIKAALKNQATIGEIYEYVNENLPLAAKTEDERKIAGIFGGMQILEILGMYKRKGIIEEREITEFKENRAYVYKVFGLA